MASLIIEKENGERVVVRNDLPECVSEYDIFYSGDYVAEKLWKEEDVRTELIVYGYEGTQDEIDAVVNTGELDSLSDSTDYDWWCIDYAIKTAQMHGDLPEVNKDEIDDK